MGARVSAKGLLQQALAPFLLLPGEGVEGFVAAGVISSWRLCSGGRGTRECAAFLTQPLAVEEYVLGGAREPPGGWAPYERGFAANLQVWCSPFSILKKVNPPN